MREHSRMLGRIMRSPAALGFYPSDRKGLEEFVERALSASKKRTKAGSAGKKSVVGAVVPHAGYAYSGKTAACVYREIDADYDSVVILGPDHHGTASKAVIDPQDWALPCGTAKNDTELGERIARLSKDFVIDGRAQRYEHSIEVQLPFLMRRIRKLKFVPIMVPGAFYTAEKAKILGAAIRKAIGKNKVLVIASSDLTHFGRTYGFVPAKDGLEWVKNTDREIIEAILRMKPEDVQKAAGKTTACGYGPVMVMMYAVSSSSAELIDYSTSYDVSGDSSAIVGYAGIVFR